MPPSNFGPRRLVALRIDFMACLLRLSSRPSIAASGGQSLRNCHQRRVGDEAQRTFAPSQPTSNVLGVVAIVLPPLARRLASSVASAISMRSTHCGV